jgi:pimeloyl-ACP methyl ester carboxylesterase
MSTATTTRYAKCGDLSIAYQVVGEGPFDVVLVPGIISHVEFFHELPGYSDFIAHLASFARVISFDKRGTGLSDRVADAPTYEQRMDDVRAVMQAAGSERAALFGISEGGALSALFAATHPERVRALVVYGTFARLSRAPDYPLGFEREAEEALFWALLWPGTAMPDDPEEREARLRETWGTGVSLPLMAASRRDDPRARELCGRAERLAATPTGFRALMEIIWEIDVRAVLPSVRVPTLVLHPEGDIFPQAISRYFADHSPGARFSALEGLDHYPWFDDTRRLASQVEEFLTGARSEPEEADRVLATVLFTDIVDSTARMVEVGDQRWRELLDEHNARVRGELSRFRGRELDTAGDGFLASFDGPARAIRCAAAIRDAVAGLGLRTRAGLHTGECERLGDRLTGIAVHTGARVAAQADAGEILVSSTVRDLVAGSGLGFADRGVHRLKGVPGEWRLFAAEP